MVHNNEAAGFDPDTVSPAQLLSTINEMADTLDNIDTGDVFASFGCGEIEAIAEVLRVAGRDETAAFIIAEHAEDDDAEDEHYLGEVS